MFIPLNPDQREVALDAVIHSRESLIDDRHRYTGSYVALLFYSDQRETLDWLVRTIENADDEGIEVSDSGALELWLSLKRAIDGMQQRMSDAEVETVGSREFIERLQRQNIRLASEAVRAIEATGFSISMTMLRGLRSMEAAVRDMVRLKGQSPISSTASDEEIRRRRHELAHSYSGER